MQFVFDRKINYYETDMMGIVHHSNYVRFLEEARCHMLEEIGYPYSKIEASGIMIPVLEVNCKYKKHVTYGDVIKIEVYIKDFSGVKMVVGYNVTNKESGEIVLQAESKHCFTNTELKPIALKKYNKDLYEKLQNVKK